jgi:putative membrane protein
MYLCAVAWRVLLLEPVARVHRLFVWARAVREGTGNLIGIIPGTGEVAGARELTMGGVRPGTAGAATVVDLTTEIASQIVFTIIGVAILIGSGRGGDNANWLIVSIAVASLSILGFVIAQRLGLIHLVETLPERFGLTNLWPTLPPGERLHDGIQDIYRAPGRFTASTALHLAAWLLTGVETLVALHLMGYPLSFAESVALESIVFALRTSAFFVPWGAGVQEGGYVLLGGLVGIPPGAALALSILKRAREIVTGAPVVIMWQWMESQRLIRARGGRSPAS